MTVLHRLTLSELSTCAEAWAPDARLVGNVRAGDIVEAVREAQGALSRAEQAEAELERFKATLAEPDKPDEMCAPYRRGWWREIEAHDKTKTDLAEVKRLLHAETELAAAEFAQLIAIARFWKHRFNNTDQYTQDCTCPTCQTLTEETAEVPE